MNRSQEIFSKPDNFFLIHYTDKAVTAKREATFRNVKIYQQLKHVASLIKFNTECGIHRSRASLRKVTMNMAIPVKRLPFLIFYLFNFTYSVADRTRVV